MVQTMDLDENELLCITNIQRMCFHDGPGIRTTVFLKGCSIHCPWCSNPECIRFEKEEYEVNGVRGVYGCDYSQNELIDELIKDKEYWMGKGGVTFSGGEAILKASSLKPVLQKLKSENVNVFFETSLFVPKEYVEEVIDLVDGFIVDVKILDSCLCYEVLGGDIEKYKRNVSYLHKKDRIYVFRIPCNVEYTLDKDNAERILDFLRDYKDVPIQIFATHTLGETKYKSLGLNAWRGEKISEETLEFFQDKLISQGNKVEIVKL